MLTLICGQTGKLWFSLHNLSILVFEYRDKILVKIKGIKWTQIYPFNLSTEGTYFWDTLLCRAWDLLLYRRGKSMKLKLQLCWNNTRETHYYHDTKIKDTVRKGNHRTKFLKKTDVLSDYMVVYICQNSQLPTWEGWVLLY